MYTEESARHGVISRRAGSVLCIVSIIHQGIIPSIMVTFYLIENLFLQK